MKKLNINVKSIAIFFASLMLFISCTQYENPLYENDSNLIIPTFKGRQLTNLQIQQIGVDHNKNLKKLFVNAIDINDLKANFVSIIKHNTQKSIKTNDFTNDVLENYVKSTNGMNTENLGDFVEVNKEYFNNYDLLKTLLVQLNNAESKLAMSKVESEARNSLTGIDLDMFLVNASVSNASLDFWNDAAPEASIEMKSNWKRTDGISAAIGFIVLACVVSALALCAGTGGLAMPAVAVVAEIAGIGLGSALSSAVAYFGLD